MDSLHNLNFENQDSISKEKAPIQHPVMEQPELVGLEQLEQKEQLQNLAGPFGENMITSSRQDDGYRYVNFSEEAVQERIKESVKLSISHLSDQKYSYVEANKLSLEAEGSKEKLREELSRLSERFSDHSLQKREKELKASAALFAQLDKKREKMLQEKDPYKKLSLQMELIDLKAKALSHRAKAIGTFEGAVNDALANIGIAANYEKLELLGKRYHDGDGGANDPNSQGLLHANHQSLLTNAIQQANENIQEIVDRRKRHRPLDVYNAAYRQRREELRDRDEQGRVRADVKRNLERQERGTDTIALMEEGLADETSKALDSTMEKSMKKDTPETLQQTFTIKGKVAGLIQDMKGCVSKIKEGKPILKSGRDALDHQVAEIVTLCTSFLDKNKEKENAENPQEKACFQYVKELKEKLENKKGGFKNQFTTFKGVLLDYHGHNYFSAAAEGKENTEVRNKAVKRRLEKDDATLAAKGLEVLKDKKLEPLLGSEQEDLTLEKLRENSRYIQVKAEGKPVPLKELKLQSLEEEKKWEHADAAIAVDALLRVRGIHLENGAVDVMKAIPANTKSVATVLQHYGLALQGGNALLESKDLISRFLNQDQYSLMHSEYVIEEEDKLHGEKEKNSIFEAVMKDILTATANGSGAAVFDSKSGKYITIAGYDEEKKTFRVLDDSGKAAKELSGDDLYNTLMQPAQVIKVEWIQDKKAFHGEAAENETLLNGLLYTRQQTLAVAMTGQSSLDQSAEAFQKQFKSLQEKHGGLEGDPSFGAAGKILKHFEDLRQYVKDSLYSGEEVKGFRNHILQNLVQMQMDCDQFNMSQGYTLLEEEPEYISELRTIVSDVSTYLKENMSLQRVGEWDRAVLDKNQSLQGEVAESVIPSEKELENQRDNYTKEAEEFQPALQSAIQKIQAADALWKLAEEGEEEQDNPMLDAVRDLKVQAEFFQRFPKKDYIAEGNVAEYLKASNQISGVVARIKQESTSYLKTALADKENLSEAEQKRVAYVEKLLDIVSGAEFKTMSGYFTYLVNQKSAQEEEKKRQITEQTKKNLEEQGYVFVEKEAEKKKGSLSDEYEFIEKERTEEKKEEKASDVPKELDLESKLVMRTFQVFNPAVRQAVLLLSPVSKLMEAVEKIEEDDFDVMSSMPKSIFAKANRFYEFLVKMSEVNLLELDAKASQEYEQSFQALYTDVKEECLGYVHAMRMGSHLNATEKQQLGYMTQLKDMIGGGAFTEYAKVMSTHLSEFGQYLQEKEAPVREAEAIHKRAVEEFEQAQKEIEIHDQAVADFEEAEAELEEEYKAALEKKNAALFAEAEAELNKTREENQKKLVEATKKYEEVMARLAEEEKARKEALEKKNAALFAEAEAELEEEYQKRVEEKAEKEQEQQKQAEAKAKQEEEQRKLEEEERAREEAVEKETEERYAQLEAELEEEVDTLDLEQYIPVYNKGLTEEMKEEQKKNSVYDPYRDIALQRSMEKDLDAIQYNVLLLKNSLLDLFNDQYVYKESSIGKEDPFDDLVHLLDQYVIYLDKIQKHLSGNGSMFIPTAEEVEQQYISRIRDGLQMLPKGEEKDSLSSQLQSVEPLLEIFGRKTELFNQNHDDSKRSKEESIEDHKTNAHKQFFFEAAEGEVNLPKLMNQTADAAQISAFFKSDIFKYIAGTSKKEISMKRIDSNRKIPFKQVKTPRSKLKVCEQNGNNCWACSMDVLMQSRGYKIKDGDKGVMRYLPKRIQTAKDAAEYYGLVVNSVYSIGEQSELLESIVDMKKYGLVESIHYPIQQSEIEKSLGSDAKNEEKMRSFVAKETVRKAKELLHEIMMATLNGSAVSLRIPGSSPHYITITSANSNKLTYLDSIHAPNPITLENMDKVNTFLRNMLRRNSGADGVVLYWLMDKEKAKKHVVGKNGITDYDRAKNNLISGKEE